MVKWHCKKKCIPLPKTRLPYQFGWNCYCTQIDLSLKPFLLEVDKNAPTAAKQLSLEVAKVHSVKAPVWGQIFVEPNWVIPLGVSEKFRLPSPPKNGACLKTESSFPSTNFQGSMFNFRNVIFYIKQPTMANHGFGHCNLPITSGPHICESDNSSVITSRKRPRFSTAVQCFQRCQAHPQKSYRNVSAVRFPCSDVGLLFGNMEVPYGFFRR